MRAMLCRCRRRLEARDDEGLLEEVREHLAREHPTIPASDKRVAEMVATSGYGFELAEVYAGGFGPDEEFGPEPY